MNPQFLKWNLPGLEVSALVLSVGGAPEGSGKGDVSMPDAIPAMAGVVDAEPGPTFPARCCVSAPARGSKKMPAADAESSMVWHVFTAANNFATHAMS
jgi:hypothetical protein